MLAHLRFTGTAEKDVAERIGLSKNHFSRIVTGRVAVTPKTAKALEGEYGIQADWLLYGKQPVRVAPKGDKGIRMYVEMTPETTAPGKAEVRERIRREYYCGQCEGRVGQAMDRCPHCTYLLDWPVIKEE